MGKVVVATFLRRKSGRSTGLRGYRAVNLRKLNGGRWLLKMNLRCVYGEYTVSIRRDYGVQLGVKPD